MKQPSAPRKDNTRELLRYAGLGSQIMAALVIAVFAGIKADKLLHTFPLLACLLPLGVLSALFYKLFRETGKGDKPD